MYHYAWWRGGARQDADPLKRNLRQGLIKTDSSILAWVAHEPAGEGGQLSRRKKGGYYYSGTDFPAGRRLGREVDYYGETFSTGFPAGRGEGRDCGLFPSSFKLGGVNRNVGGLHRLSGPAWKYADRAAAVTERMTCIHVPIGLTRDVATRYTQRLGATVRREEPARLRRAHSYPGAGVSPTASLGIV